MYLSCAQMNFGNLCRSQSFQNILSIFRGYNVSDQFPTSYRSSFPEVIEAYPIGIPKNTERLRRIHYLSQMSSKLDTYVFLVHYSMCGLIKLLWEWKQVGN